MMATQRIRKEPRRHQEREGPGGEAANALVIGYGRFGQTVAQMLLAAGIPVTLIDTDTEMIDVAREFGAQVYFGDGTRLDLLRQAGAAEAELILFCLDGEQPDAELLRAVREAFPQAAILVRAYDRRMLVELRDAPIDYVVREVMESAVQMGRAALEQMGDSREDIDRAEAFYRANDRERRDMQVEHGEIRDGRVRTITERHTWAEAGSEL
jgi:CPA2 family monovalent cation:H+ antiporter-2/glutathione-regulated potassium-efflux system protein KefB